MQLDKRILLVLLLLTLPVFAVTERFVTKDYVGCDPSNPSDFNCEGQISDVVCDTVNHICSATCKKLNIPACRMSECLDDELHTGDCGGYIETYTLNGLFLDGAVRESIESRSICPYNDWGAYTSEYVCVGGLCDTWFSAPLLLGVWNTQVTVSCVLPECSSYTSSTVICEKEEVEIVDTVNIPDEGVCTTGHQICVGLERKECNDDGQWVISGSKCAELCCDVNKKNVNSYCAKRTDISSSKAVCVNLDDYASQYECTNESTYRCNEQIVEVCRSGEWQFFEECQYPCNSTATAAGYQPNFCTTYNTKVGGCAPELSTVCQKVGPDSFLFTCLVEDWVLTKECASGRCGENATSCYEGCELYSEMCYNANNFFNAIFN